MATLQKTYSGDLTQSIARRLSAIAGSASHEADQARKTYEIVAASMGQEGFWDPEDSPFYRSINLPFGMRITDGSLFRQALKYKFTPNPMGLFGSRFHKKPFSPEMLTGQRRAIRSPNWNKSPVGPFKTNSYIMNKLAGQPFPEVNVGAPLKYQRPITRGASYGPAVTPTTPIGSSSSPLTSTGKGQAIQVKDPKLGKFFTAVSRSLSASILGMTEKMDSNEESLISAKDGILGTIKKLEFSSQTLEDKLDAIIKALREQARTAFVAEDNKEKERTDANIKLQKIQYEGEVIQKKDEDDAEFALRDAIDEAQDNNDMDGAPSPLEGQRYKAPELARGGIVDGPQSGYPAILHGREAVVPLDTPFTRQNYAAGTLGVNKPLTNNVMKDETTAPSFEKFVPNMFKEIIESKVTDLPNIKETTEMLGKAVELPVKASGLVAFNVLGKALSGMKTLAGDVTTPLKQVLSPLTAFGVQNNVINSLTRDLNVGGAAVKRQERNKQLGSDQKQGNMLTRFFNKIMSIVNPPPPDNNDNKKDGEGGPGYVGGGAKYVGGGSGNFFEGAKNWWNRGRNVNVKSENTARWFGRDGLFADDWKQRGKFGKGGKLGGWDFTRGFRPGVPANEGGMMSGPTPAIRQSVERPLRAIRSLGAAKGGFVGLILNELMNPAPLADGTLTGNMNVVNSSQFNRTDKTDKMNNFVELRSLENQISKINNFEAQQSKIIQINNQGTTEVEKESPLNLIADNPDTTMDVFFPSPYNY